MITKLVVKDYADKKCPYLTSRELDDKSLVELVKDVLKNKEDALDILDLDAEEKMGFSSEEDERDSAINIFNILRDYPSIRKVIENSLKVDKNPVEELIEKYSDNQLISNLSRTYIESIYGEDNCYRCDLEDGKDEKKELIDQELINENTQKALKDENVKVLFEGQLEFDNKYRARFDVLIKNDDGTYDLYEVKGTNNVCEPTSDKLNDKYIKDKYLYDLVFQYFVYTNCGLKFKNIGYITTNPNFETTEEKYPTPVEELKDLFRFKKEINLKSRTYTLLDYIEGAHYTEKLKGARGEPQQDIKEILEEIDEIAKSPSDFPKMSYNCRKNPVCPLLKMCHKKYLTTSWIYSLTNWGSFGGYWGKTKNLIDQGITDLKQIDENKAKSLFEDKIAEGKQNNALSQILLASTYKDKDYFIKKDYIKEIIDKDYFNGSIEYLIFFDFESFQHPIPLVKHSKPWKQVVSQYSMHVVKSDYDLTKHDFGKGEGGGIWHREFIGNPDEDGYENPSIKLFERLRTQLKELNIDYTKDNYKVVVFNQNFESKRMGDFCTDFASIVEDKTLIDFVGVFKERIVDLLDFFTRGGIYGREFMGRGSLKVVQPALINDSKVREYYTNLEPGFIDRLTYSLDYHKDDKCLVYNGSICLDLYKSLLIRHHKKESTIGLPTGRLLEEAKAYCKIDSWGTVIIYDIIKHILLGDIKLNYTTR